MRALSSRWSSDCCSRCRLFPGGTSSARPSCSAARGASRKTSRSEEHTSELQSHLNLVCRLLLEKKNVERHFVSLCAAIAELADEEVAPRRDHALGDDRLERHVVDHCRPLPHVAREDGCRHRGTV